MGTSTHTLALRHDVRESVRVRLIDWLERRGLTVDPRPLLPLDRERERGAYLATNDAWTLIVYCDFEEERRLALELGKLQRPVLALWCHDSDIWGYSLIEDGRATVEFSSPSGGFIPTSYFGEERPEGLTNPDLEHLCRALECSGLEERIRAHHRKRSILTERTLESLCRTLGLEGAVTQFEDLEQDEPFLGTWRVEQLRFRRPGAPARIDLHSDGLWASQIPPTPHEPSGPSSPPWDLRLFHVLLSALLLPLRLLFALWMAWQLRAVRRQLEARSDDRGPRPYTSTRGEPPFRLDGRRLSNLRHRCSIELPEGAVVPPWEEWDPWAVFKFSSPRLSVSCLAQRLTEIRALSAAGEVLADEKFLIAGRKARRRVTRVQIPRQDQRVDREDEVILVEGPDLVYVFRGVPLPLHNGRSQGEATGLRALVETFSFIASDDPEGPPPSV